MIDVAVHRGSGAVYALSQTDVFDTSTSRTSADVFLRRYNRSGTVVWRRQLGSAELDSARALTTDSSGNIYVSYNDKLEKRRSDGSLVWSRSVRDVWALSTDRTGNLYVGSSDYHPSVILSKYTAAGSRTWTRSVTGGGIAFTPTGIATDASGNVYVVATDVDDCCLWNRLLKYSPGGQQLINKEIGAVSGDVALSDVVVQGNALYLAGTRHSNWGDNIDTPNNEDGLLVKLSLGGTERWRRVFGTPKRDRVNSLAADANGGLYLTGLTFGNLGGVYSGGSDAFLRKYSSSGQTLWTKQIGSPGDDRGNVVSVFGSSELYLGGEAGGALADTTHRGGQDGFLRRTDGQGNRIWTDQ